jgi:hypothetical protein
VEGSIVSPVCPKCQSRNYKRVRPKSWVAFRSDRVCTACTCRYTPPTPLWAGPIFVTVGVLLAAVGSLAALVPLLKGRLTDPIGVMFFGALAILGFLAVAHGLRVLRAPGKV